MKNNNYNKGYTLLFAVIVSTVVLSIAAFILTISRKQFILASAARDSTVAVYVADSGIECAVEAYDSNYLSPSSPQPFNCNGTTLTPSYSSSGTPPPNVTFDTGQQVNYGVPMTFTVNGNCAVIVVSDGIDLNTHNHITVLDSSGYNIGCNGAGAKAGPRVVERAIQLVYHD